MRSNCSSEVTADSMALFQVVLAIGPSGLFEFFPLTTLQVLTQLWVTHRSSPDYKSVAAQQRSIEWETSGRPMQLASGTQTTPYAANLDEDLLPWATY